MSLARRHTVVALGLAISAILMIATPRSPARELASGDVIPPVRPESPPAFRVPAEGERLDEQWSYQQTLMDADTNYPQYFNAVPVGLAFTHGGRGFLAMLHTVFRSSNGGQRWFNMDLSPPPFGQNSEFQTLRAPTYITAMGTRPGSTGAITGDSLLLTTMNADSDRGTVRIIFNLFGYVLYQDSLLTAPHWLTGVVIPDTLRALVFAGLDGTMYENRGLRYLPYSWDALDPDKVIIRDGRRDSMRLRDTWVSGFAGADSLVIAVGSHQWISRDGGRRWRIQRASDPVYDNVVSFCDTLHGLTGGGQLTPVPAGWVRRTRDGARSWFPRSLVTDLPIRAVLMINPDIAYVAGGNSSQARGAVWHSSDGGASWNRELTTDAEIRALASFRFNAQYVDVVAAGFFPDFRGGVWKSRLYLPDTSAIAVLEAEPDTLDFGLVAPGTRVSRQFVLRNRGSIADTLSAISGTSSTFQITGFEPGRPLPVGDSVLYGINFGFNVRGPYGAAVQIEGHSGQRVEVYCYGTVGVAATRERSARVPDQPQLTIWPNPGNGLFRVQIGLSQSARAAVKVYTLDGRFVHTLADGEFTAGTHELAWDASAQAAGIYFLRLEAANRLNRTEKLLLIK